MEETVFQAERRDVLGKQVKAMRRAGKLPAVLYGHSISPIPIWLSARDTNRVMPGITSSHLVTIDVNGETHTALVREKQRHPVQGHLLHVDFMVVSMTERLRANVTIELDGHSPASKNFGGVIVTGVEDLEVECLPGNLPERILVDISGLENIGDAIYVRDLQLDSSIEILTDLDELVVLVTAQEAEEKEEVEEEIEEEEFEPEVIERGKKEDDF